MWASLSGSRSVSLFLSAPFHRSLQPLLFLCAVRSSHTRSFSHGSVLFYPARPHKVPLPGVSAASRAGAAFLSAGGLVLLGSSQAPHEERAGAPLWAEVLAGLELAGCTRPPEGQMSRCQATCARRQWVCLWSALP